MQKPLNFGYLVAIDVFVIVKGIEIKLINININLAIDKTIKVFWPYASALSWTPFFRLLLMLLVIGSIVAFCIWLSVRR